MERGSEATGATRPGAIDAAPPVLALPEGWVIDEVTSDRLLRQLAAAPPHVSGVVAEGGELPAGASYRVHAEWRALEPVSAAVETATTTARGAVLLRPGVGFDVDGDVVEVERGPVLLDPGAHAHDPARPVGPLRPASVRGRPPFPRRPVAVLLADEAGEDLARWARDLVNGLMEQEVEGRMAMPVAVGGRHLTRPCLPDDDSVAALAPDVVVALDGGARGRVPRLCPQDRSLVAIELHPDAAGAEVISWRLGRASGRVRARIGRDVEAAALAELVHRLCAGPHPLPPVDPAGGDEVEQRRPRRPVVRRSAVVLTDALDADATVRVDGLVDNLTAAGVTVESGPLGRLTPSTASSADIVVLAGRPGYEPARELLEVRRASGRPTVIDLSAALRFDGPDGLSLTPWAAELAVACALATASVPAVEAAARRMGVRAHLLPTVLTRARAVALRRARSWEKRAEPIVGWSAGPANTLPPAHIDAAGEAVAKLLAERPDVSVEVVGESVALPPDLRDHERVRSLPGQPEPEALARWTAHLWTPPLLGKEVMDDLRWFVEACSAGVPTVLAETVRHAPGIQPPQDLVVERPDQPGGWATVLGSLLQDDHRRRLRAREATRQADALYGPTPSKAVVNRFLGWVLFVRVS